MTEKTLDYDALQITLVDVFRQMGYHDVEPDEVTQRETQAIICEARSWLRPRFCYFVTGEQPAFDLGRTILRQLSSSEAYALFICTSGVEYEAYQQQLKAQGDMLRVFIADALGRLGWKHTNRYSPGYCGWHVSEQQLLFPLFEGHTCGVRLTDSSLMLPIKSVSGIIGIGEKVRKLDYTCGLCDFEKCYKRRKPL